MTPIRNRTGVTAFTVEGAITQTRLRQPPYSLMTSWSGISCARVRARLQSVMIAIK
jgi:hypothetical protein